jgi:hypothetical protein
VLTRLLAWRLLGLAAALLGVATLAWLEHGGLGAALRGAPAEGARVLHRIDAARPHKRPPRTPHLRGGPPWAAVEAGVVLLSALGAGVLGLRWRARRRRAYVRLRVVPYRTDRTSVEGVVAVYEALHKRLQQRWWRRLVGGQPSVALEAHYVRSADGVGRAVLAVACPRGAEAGVEAALRAAYPNCRVTPEGVPVCRPTAVVRLKKHAAFIKRVKEMDRYELAREPPMDRLLTVMAASGQDAMVQLVMTPAPAWWENYAKHRYKRHEAHLARERREHLFVRDRSLVEEAELRGGLDVQHRPLYYTDLRVVAPTRQACETTASELRAEGAENRLVERSTAVRHGLAGAYRRRVQRGEGNPWPAWHRGVWASTELAAVWHAPSVDYATVPLDRSAVPLAPAPPAIMRPREGPGLLRDAYGPVSIHPNMRRQNTAVPGAVEQGKTSYLAATVAEDLRRERCAVIVLDPKGDAAEVAVSAVPPERTCTLLDLAHPTCGFNPLAVDAPADTIADYVVGALKQLYTDADIRASSDRYLRNAIIAVLAHDRRATLWDAARLLSVGEEGYAYRARVGAHVRTLPEYREIAQFFTAELTAQLADARSTTTAKLDAPVNKLARLLNSPSIKRVLLNESLTIDLDRTIANREVLIVKGALGAMGAGNTSVVLQLLVGMLDAALARQQDATPAAERTSVALKVDEAPLVLNRGFAETLALKRSAGLETVACWQTDAQWTDREVRAQLDALFAHRVYFATASAADAREAAKVTMAQYSDTVRPDVTGLTALGRPDARLHLPRHHAIVSWVTPEGRQAPFVASTVPMRTDPERLALHAARQATRGGRYLDDLAQPHWERRERATGAREGREPDGSARGREPEREGRGEGGIVHAGERGVEAERRGASVPHDYGGREVEGQESSAHGGHGEGNAATAGRAGTHGERASVAGQAARTPREADGPREDPPAGERPADQAWAPLPATVAESYAELVALDAAHTVRWARVPTVPTALDPDPLDVEALATVVSLRHVLTTQIHRRVNPERSLTTTQRRLKRLSDAGLVQRFQFHRRDGGGAPMCYVASTRGVEVLRAYGREAPESSTAAGPSGPASIRPTAAPAGLAPDAPPGPRASSAQRHTAETQLRQARHNVHVAGWVLALERAVGAGRLKLHGPEESALSPPLRATAAGHVALGPGELRLPGGRAPHGFLRTEPSGVRVETERFETVRPDASVEVPVGRVAEDVPSGTGGDEPSGWPAGVASGRVWLAVERDDRLTPAAAAKLERYDHLLAGWAVCTPRFARRGAPRPAVVFLCRDRPRARECARRADHVLTACRAYAGERPRDWEYPGRAALAWVSERDVHEGQLVVYGVPPLPPDVRAAGPGAGPRAREATCEPRVLLGGSGVR